MKQHDDVRMRGFRSRQTVSAALEWVDTVARPLDTQESIPLADAMGRVLIRDVVASISVPRFDRSAMDGFAVIAQETVGASSNSPVMLRVVDQSLPGLPSAVALQSGCAVRIMTGAPLPEGATAVVPVELTRPCSGCDDTIEVVEAVPDLKHVGRVGEDIASGSLVVSGGTQLLPQHLGVLASVGEAAVEVIRRPRVRVVTTGREIVEPGEPLQGHQIHDANSEMLQALIQRDGGMLESLIRVADHREDLQEAIMSGGADVVIVSGGTSVGAEDFAPAIVAENGELPIHGIAMRPSSPTGMGRVGDAIIFLLPGNPVSCLCAYDFFAGRAVRSLAGRRSQWPYTKQRVPLERRIVSAIGRTDYCRVRWANNGLEPVAVGGASVLSSTTRADGFVVVPETREGFAVGTKVTVWWYSGSLADQMEED